MNQYNKMNEMPIHILVDIYWLPPENPDFKIPPDTNFRTNSFFTSDLSEGWTVEINCSKKSFPDSYGYPARLFFYALDEKREKIKQPIKNAEILIMDGYKVIAVCRNLNIPEDILFINLPWVEN